jgi:uncharacterized protein (TIGR03000 family)
LPYGGSALAREENSAQLIVELPEDARLYVDDHAMRSTSARRTFRTPALTSGQSYYYILKAEVARNGQTYAQSQRIVLRAGDRVTARFPDLGKDVLTTAKR